MKLILPGGTGQVGNILARAFHAEGHDMIVLSRTPNQSAPWRTVRWDAETPQTRKVLMRSAMIMSPDFGGVFDTLLRLVRFGLGGKVADGRQYVSWIHKHDFVAAVRRLIADDSMTGPVNLAAPNPLPYAEFMAALRAAWGIPIGLPATAWMLEITAFVLRTESELVLKSRRVVPGRLLDAGFRFEFPTWPEAARDLVARWRAAH
jgi:NAD dependent epimerase/dehydratase family enzyme